MQRRIISAGVKVDHRGIAVERVRLCKALVCKEKERQQDQQNSQHLRDIAHRVLQLWLVAPTRKACQ